MPSPFSAVHRRSLHFLLLIPLLAILWLAGGASRADVLGQPLVRGASWFSLIVLLALTDRRDLKPTSLAVLAFIVLAALLALAQLIPLPPALWEMLPGRAPFMEAARLNVQPQPWRPWSLVPGATMNAAESLVVPLVIWMLISGLEEREQQWLPGLVLLLVASSAFLGLLQFTGVTINNSFINGTPGQVSGVFANRNHFALFQAMGCLLASVWGFMGKHGSHWRLPASWGLILLFLLTILATGSRAGLGLGVTALFLGLLMSHEPIRRSLARYPRWVFPVLIASLFLMIGTFVMLSVLADRAISINRLFAIDQGQDMRTRGLPTVLAIIRTHFPFGSGLGSFDAMFRMHEPFELLKRTYFNHAHNDFLEVALDTGLAGSLLLATAIGWWAKGSVRAWRADGSDKRHALPRLGSAILFLVIVASIFDYPARTPTIMAMVVIAAGWLSADIGRAVRGTA